MKISPARAASYDCLIRIHRDRIFSSSLLPQYEAKLTPADRALCHELVLGVLRRQRLLDAYIGKLTNEKKLDSEIRTILQLGLFQIAYLERVPDHAVVNDSVNLAVRAKKSSAKALINAVLRKAARGLPELRFANEIERIAVETSHPDWLLHHWIDQFGPERAHQIATANNVPPALAFRTTLRGRDVEIGEKYHRSEIIDNCFFADSMDSRLRDLAGRGIIYFQDEGSQLVAAAVESAGTRFLDVCASPGGKTTDVAMRREDDKPAIYAGDVSGRRVGLLKETCDKQGAEFVHIVQYDASMALPFADESFDTVLVDAPCTGSGTIRHNPEIRYFLADSDLAAMPELQLSILKNAAKAVRRGGLLVYSTCSLETEENEGVAARFLAVTPEFRKIVPKVPEQFQTDDGFARTFPSRDGMDGFFIATFERS